MARFYRYGGFTTDLEKLLEELNKHNPEGRAWDIYRHCETSMFVAMRTDTGANNTKKTDVLKTFGFEFYQVFVSEKKQGPLLRVIK